jgi:hypothetical protein
MMNDRENACRDRALTAQIVADYLEMPGLNVTLPQACRLWQLDVAQCARLLNNLLAAGFLRKNGGSYMRRRSGWMAA